jgi:hypothetical protein
MIRKGLSRKQWQRFAQEFNLLFDSYCKCPLFRTELDSTFQANDPCKEFKQTSTPSPHPRACQWQGFHVLNKNHSSRLVIYFQKSTTISYPFKKSEIA